MKRKSRWDMQRVRSLAGWVVAIAVFLGGLAWSASRQGERDPAAQVLAIVLLAAIVLLLVAAGVVEVAYKRATNQLFWHGYHDAPWHPLLLIGLVVVGSAVGSLLLLSWLALLFI